jgi:hypothetical protein
LAVRNRLSSLLPPCDIPSLLRLLRYTILEHQYQTWILRKTTYRLMHGPNNPSPPRPPQNHLETENASAAHAKIHGAGIERLGNVCEHTGRTSQQPSLRRTAQSTAQNHTWPRTKHHHLQGDAPQQPREPTQPLDNLPDPPAEPGLFIADLTQQPRLAPPPQRGEMPPDDARKTSRHHPAAPNGAASLTVEMEKASPPLLPYDIYFTT